METKWTVVCLCVGACVCVCMLLYLLHDEDCTEYFTSYCCSSEHPRSVSGLDLFPGLDLSLVHLISAGICLSLFPWSPACRTISFCFQISDICFPISPPPFPLSLFSPDFSSLSEFVYCLSRRSDSLTSLLVLSCSISHPPPSPRPPPPPVPAPLLPVSSSKRVFGCQCQSVGGGDESVALTASLAMTISADCHISLCVWGGVCVWGGGGAASYALSICPHIIICHSS